MRPEWKQISAENYCESVRDGTHDSPKQCNSVNSKYLITSKHLNDYSIDFSNAYKISIDDYQKVIERSKVHQWDILFSMIGTIGKVYQEKEEAPDYAIKNIGLFKMGEDQQKSNWLKYYLQSPQAKLYILSHLRGSTQSYVPLQTLRVMPISVPALHEQRFIISTLTCIDEKIELNNKINANLEAQAQAIFKSWFVDFEPFQNAEFVDSEMGLIPKGWRVGTLSDIGTIVGGATPSKSIKEYYTNTSKGIAWITPKDLSNNRDKFIFRGELDITELGFKHSSTKIMPQGTVLFSSRAPIGYMAIAENDVCTNQGFKSVVPDEGYGTAFVYYTLKYKLKEIQNLGSGSTFKEVSGNVMKKVIVLIPDAEVLNSFNGICEIIFNKQRNLEKQNHILADLRDTLLPKLMNGEIKVPISDEEVMESYD